MEILFWVCIFIIFYTYIGYGILITLIVRLKRLLGTKQKLSAFSEWPNVTLLIPAYNEIDFIASKIRNCIELDYPKDKLQIVFVTDGSNDGTPDFITANSSFFVWHKAARAGKIAAMNSAMELVTNPITIFCDANTLLNSESIKRIVNHFANPNVGCVAGEKRVQSGSLANASATEGVYWKYESYLKKMDSELLTVVGAAGELFSVRTQLFKSMSNDTILDDFIISLEIAKQGYKVVYEPNAYATETPSSGIKEELKRKIRISAGGIQSIVRLATLLNIFKYGLLSFQYISHRVLRWTITPLSLLVLFPLNVYLMIWNRDIYANILLLQCMFYLLALVGWHLQVRNIKLKLLFVPMYFTMMNYAVFLGFFRYIKGQQSVLWEKAKRV